MAIFGFEMSLFGAVWLTYLNSDQPFLPINEKNTCFDLYLIWMEDLDPLFGHELSHVPKRAQNGNRNAIRAYSIFRQVLITGLIGAF